jgi:hypothetical protein
MAVIAAWILVHGVALAAAVNGLSGFRVPKVPELRIPSPNDAENTGIGSVHPKLARPSHAWRHHRWLAFSVLSRLQ